MRRATVRSGRALISALLLLALLVPFGSVASAQSAVVPADGPAAVVAQGVVDLGGGQVAWRFARERTARDGSAIWPAHMPGFVLAEKGSLALIDADARRTARLDPGMAAFVAAERPPGLQTVDGTRGAYRAFALLPMEATASAEADGALISASFPAPRGPHQLLLIRQFIDRNRPLTFSTGDRLGMLFVASGTASLTAGGPPAAMSAGAATAVGGDVKVETESDRTAVVYAALIGEAIEIPAVAGSPVASPTGERGSITLIAYPCPSAATPDDACLDEQPVEMTDLRMTGEDGATLDLATARRTDDGAYHWLNVPLGDYHLASDGVTPPEGLVVRNITGSVEVVDGGWTVAVRDPNHSAVVTVFLAPVGSTPAAG